MFHAHAGAVLGPVVHVIDILRTCVIVFRRTEWSHPSWWLRRWQSRFAGRIEWWKRKGVPGGLRWWQCQRRQKSVSSALATHNPCVAQGSCQRCRDRARRCRGVTVVRHVTKFWRGGGLGGLGQSCRYYSAAPAVSLHHSTYTGHPGRRYALPGVSRCAPHQIVIEADYALRNITALVGFRYHAYRYRHDRFCKMLPFSCQ